MKKKIKNKPIKKSAKKAVKKSAKKSVSKHTDTKSHNVRIGVVSGVKKTKFIF